MLTKYERETHIYFNDKEQSAEIYTCSPSFMRKMDRLCNEAESEFMLVKQEYHQGSIVSKTYKLSSKANITLHRKKRLSTAVKTKLAEQLRK